MEALTQFKATAFTIPAMTVTRTYSHGSLTVLYSNLLSLFHLLRCPCIHDVHKFRLQRSTSNQKSVNVGLRSYTDTSQFIEYSEGLYEDEPSSLQLPALTLPPYMIRVLSPTSGDTAEARYFRVSACTSWACAAVATLPVPIAQTGS
jgi:hypothetical protein